MRFDSSPPSRFSIEEASGLVQLVSGTPLKGIRRADVVHQSGITDAVTSGASKPHSSDCDIRSDAAAKQQRPAVIYACIAPMYRRYGRGIIISITVAPHHAFVIKRIYAGDLSWRSLFLVRLRPSKILHTARPDSRNHKKTGIVWPGI